MTKSVPRRKLLFSLNQNGRFLADGSEAEGDEKQLWNLPLLYSTASTSGETQLEMMAGETHTLKVKMDERQ